MSKVADKKVYRLKQHSLAKISCYRNYVDIYLSVLANSPFEKLYLLDLFAGEGKDIDGNLCSSISGAEALKRHFTHCPEDRKKIVFFLNDPGNSVIEKGLKKIDRVKKFIDELQLPENVTVKYSSENFEDIIDGVVKRLSQLNSRERALCFIDPFGYKYSKPEKIRDLLANGKTELLLFMPICFMHRFTAKAMKDEDYTEGRHIEEFVSILFEKQIPDIHNQVAFIKGIQKQFKTYLGIPFVDIMYIEKEKSQFFALFFFSNNKKGFQKMLEAKWAIDDQNGHGFTVNKAAITNTLFDNIDHEDYTYQLYEEIRKKEVLSNQEIFDFGLNNNHLPKHTKKVLDELKRDGKIIISTSNGEAALGYYLEDNHNKKIIVSLKK
ncbi:MAG: three-Cys-motif partner protein TcmP [Flavipsychrobacter sp.]|nr:three-Cys-motif partner protein TcmP [Flavipsychrobacter sp.]